MITALIIYLVGCYACGVALHGCDENRELPAFARLGIIACSWFGVISIVPIYYWLDPTNRFYWKEVETWWPGDWFPTSRCVLIRHAKWFWIGALLVVLCIARISEMTIRANMMLYGFSGLFASLILLNVLFRNRITPWYLKYIYAGIFVFLGFTLPLKGQVTSHKWWCDNESWNEWAYNRPESELFMALPCLLNVNYGCENRDTLEPIYVLVPVADSFLTWEPESRIEPYHADDYTSTPPQWASKFYRARGEFYLDFGNTDMVVSTLYFPLVIAYDGNVEWTFYWGANGKNEWFQGGESGNMLTYQYFQGKTPQEVIDELLCAALQPYE